MQVISKDCATGGIDFFGCTGLNWITSTCILVVETVRHGLAFDSLTLTDRLLQTLNGGLELSSLSIVCRELPSNTTYYHNRPQLFNNPQLAIISVPSPQFPIIFGSDAKLEGMSLPVSRPSGMIP